MTAFTNNPINNLIVEYLYIYHILLARVNHNSIYVTESREESLDFIGVTLSLPSLLVLPVLSGDRWGLGNQIYGEKTQWSLLYKFQYSYKAGQCLLFFLFFFCTYHSLIHFDKWWSKTLFHCWNCYFVTIVTCCRWKKNEQEANRP